MSQTKPACRVVVVTGLSGAGKSTALRALEDLGYFCVDNLPSALVERTVEVCEQAGMTRIGLGMDVRALSFLDGAADAVESISRGRDVVVLFLDANDSALLRRFSETRRPHPLSTAARTQAGSVAVDILDGVHAERTRLAPLRARATLDLDTTLLSVHELRRQVVAHLGPGKAEQPRMTTRLVSFGYKFGIPVDADLVLDVRFLDNPYFVQDLRPLSGVDPSVRDYVLDNPETKGFLEHAMGLLSYCLPRYEREGKSYLTIAIGCTGGRHRSVALANRVADLVRDGSGLQVTVVHRDVGRSESLAQVGAVVVPPPISIGPAPTPVIGPGPSSAPVTLPTGATGSR